MSTCLRCHRPLKEHHESGLGSVCRRKAQTESDAKPQVRIYPLSKTNLPKRRYLVFGESRATVVVKETGSGRFAECENCDFRCNHIELVGEYDNARFPQEAK